MSDDAPEVETPKRRRSRDEARPHRVEIRLSDTEFAAVAAAAARDQMTPGAWAADAAVALAREKVAPIPTSERDQLRAMVDAQIQVGRIGTNLNQVARKLNSEEEAPELARVLALVERVLTRLDEATVEVIGGKRRGR